VPEPYRLLFPMGVAFGVAAALVWPAYALGWIAWPGPLHATLMIQGFEHCFVLGFFLTALPAFTRGEKCTRTELAIAAGAMPLFALLLALRLGAAAQLVYAATVALLLVASVRRLRRALTPAPEEFAFVIIGFAVGVAGAGLRALAEAGLAVEPAPRFGLRMISLGMVLPIVLGFGALLVPTFTMMKRPLAVPGLAGAHERGPRRVLYLALIAALLAAVVAEGMGSTRPGAWIRAGVGAVMIVWVWKLFRLPGRRDLVSAALWFAGWLVLAGLLVAALRPDLTLTAYHATFVGGYGLLTLGIATRVVASHGGYGMPGEKQVLTAWVFGAAVFALVLRMGGEARPPIGPVHLVTSGVLWALAWLLWARGAAPKLTVTSKPVITASRLHPGPARIEGSR